MLKKEVAFLEGQLFIIQSELFKKHSKSSDWLEKSRTTKIKTLL